MIHAIYSCDTPLEPHGITLIRPRDVWGDPLELDGAMTHLTYTRGIPLELDDALTHLTYTRGIPQPLELDDALTHLTYTRGIPQPLELDGVLTHLIYFLENALQLDGSLIQWLSGNLDFPWEILS